MAKCTGVRCPMQYGYKVEECNHTDCPYRTEPITNADRIRAMTDEELAYLIRCGVCELIGATQDHCETNTCVDCVLGWLKQPAE